MPADRLCSCDERRRSFCERMGQEHALACRALLLSQWHAGIWLARGHIRILAGALKLAESAASVAGISLLSFVVRRPITPFVLKTDSHRVNIPFAE